MLSHERLDVYHKSLDFLEIAITVNANFPRGSSALADQMKRASMSIVLNIAEGAGRLTTADKNRHFVIARGSAFECAAILDVALRTSAIDKAIYCDGKVLVTSIAGMLTRLAGLSQSGAGAMSLADQLI